MGNVNTIGNKYLGVTDNSIMFLTKGSTNIMTRLESSDENLYKFFSVNDSGKKIMESIDGSATINDFIKNFCENYNLEYETNKGWIAAFIMEMIQKKALKLSEIPMDNSKVLLQGSEDTISPVHATIEITEKCNLKCKHCYLEAGICKTSMIDYDRFEKLVDEMVANHVLNVEITGGEIFMHPRVLDILKLCYKKFAMLGILTNGTIMTDEVLELIAENKDRTVVNISIDAVDPDMHDEFRGMKGSWKASCNTIRRLADNSDTLLHETEHLGDILKTEFTQKALDIEKKTIYQEHLYRSSTFSLDSVNTALGTVEEINNFDLEKLKKARDIALQKYKLLFINPEPKRLGKELKKAPVYRINDNWYKNIVITHFENNGNSINIRLKKDIYAELFVYALRILSMCSFDAYEIEHLRSENFIDIKLPFGKEEFLKMIKDKDKIFSRYILYLSTMKVYHQELAYCVNNIGVDFETHKCFMNEWEEKVIENF